LSSCLCQANALPYRIQKITRVQKNIRPLLHLPAHTEQCQRDRVVLEYRLVRRRRFQQAISAEIRARRAAIRVRQAGREYAGEEVGVEGWGGGVVKQQ